MMYDINLIPQTKKNASGRINSTMIFIGLFCFVVLAVFFFYFPLQQKLSLNKQIQEKESEISSYANVEQEYITLADQADRLDRTAKALESLKSDRVKLTEVLNKIEKNIPKKVTVNSITLSEGLFTLEASSSTYKEISQFIVNLRGIEGVLSVTFSSAAAQEDSDASSGGSSANSYNKEQIHDFTIFVRYDMKDVISELQLNASAAEAAVQ